MKGRTITYSTDELAWVEANRKMPRRALHAAFCARFRRDDVSQDNLTALCKRKGWRTGRTGQFHRDQVPHNKGKPFSPPGSEKGRFRQGERRGRANDNYQPIGTERVTRNGYLERKIHDGMPLQSRWRAVHLVRWEEINGPLQPGMCLKCLDGDKANTDPSNWTAISRALLPRLAGRWHMPYDTAPPELKPTLLAVAHLEDQVRTRRRARTGATGSEK